MRSTAAAIVAMTLVALVPVDVAAQTVGAGRVLDCEPESGFATDDSSHTVTCSVTDASGNPVQGVDVTFTEEGPGSFTSEGTTPAPDNDAQDGQEHRSDGAGQVSVTVQLLQTHTYGIQTITGTITGQAAGLPEATTECRRAADDPSGAPAGACQDSVEVEWSNGIVADYAYARTVTIRHRPRLAAFTGGVHSPRRGCYVRSDVVVKQVREGSDRIVGRDATDSEGKWRVNGGGRAGRYYAVVLYSRFTPNNGDFVECLRNRSVTIRID